MTYKIAQQTSSRPRREPNPLSPCHPFLRPVSWTNLQTSLVIARLLMCICLYCLVRNLISHATNTTVSLQFSMHFDDVFCISLKSHLLSQYHMLLICSKALKRNEKGIITNEKATANKQPTGIQLPWHHWKKRYCNCKPFKTSTIIIWQEKNVGLGGALQSFLNCSIPLQHSQITRQCCVNE